MDDTETAVLVELVMVTRFGDAMAELAEGIFNGCGQTLATGTPVIEATGKACPAGLLIALTWVVPYGKDIVRGAGFAVTKIVLYLLHFLYLMSSFLQTFALS